MLDAIILGAGAAGLAAAAELARAGCSGVVIEARDRIGGRIHSLHLPDLPVPIELGAEFIHGRAKPVFELLDKAGGTAIDSGGEHWSLSGGKLRASDELFSEIQAALREQRVLAKRDVAFDELLDVHLKHALSTKARDYARTLAQGFDAADTRLASSRAIVEEWTGAASVESDQFRPLGGYEPLLSHLAGTLRASAMRLQLETPIAAIRWRRGHVEVRGTFEGRTHSAVAKRAIVTLPLGVLQRSARAGGVRFAPTLVEKREALRQLAAGPVIKVLLRFRSRFWESLENGRYRNASFFHSPGAAFPTFWTALPMRTSCIVAWVAGPKAIRFARADRPRIVRDALASFSALFAGRADVEAELVGANVHDWQSDPYARGAYSYVLVGGEHARKTLARPLRSTLFFAGEAADCGGEAGTVAGALQSGTRAAGELLEAARNR